MTKKMIAIILGGGAGTSLYPLTATLKNLRFRLQVNTASWIFLFPTVLTQVSGRMFVLTQFNSASLNKHIKNTYHFSVFSSAFVDILAAEQTPDNPPGSRVQRMRCGNRCDILNNMTSNIVLILSGDQLYQMDFQGMLENHVSKGARYFHCNHSCGRKRST